MSTRNHTKFFMQLRSASRKSHVQLEDGLSSGVPPEWVSVTQDIQVYVDDLKTKMQQLKELHNRHLLPGFEDRQEEEARIKDLTSQITGLFSLIKERIQSFGTKANPEAKTSEDTKIRKAIQTNLAIQLQELSNMFKQSQESYLSRLQSMEQRAQNMSAGLNMDASSDVGPSIVNRGFNQRQLDLIQQNDDVIRQRASDIDDLLRSIQDLASIFNDLSTLVIEQGTLLDQIEHNVQEVVMHTHQAKKELDKANQSQKSYRNKLCIFILLLGILALAIVLMVKPAKGSDSTSDV